MIQLRSGQLSVAAQSLDYLAEKELPYLVVVQLRRLQKAVGEFHTAWLEAVTPFIQEFGEEGSISPHSPRFLEFCRAIEPLCEDTITLEVEPLSSEGLQSVSLRGDRLGVLMDLGLVS